TQKIEVQNMADGGNAVFPGNLFALQIIAREIGNRQLEDAQLQLRDLGGDLRLKAEPLRLQVDIGDHVAAKEFVAGLHVGQIHAATEVAHDRQNPVHQVMKGAVHLLA